MAIIHFCLTIYYLLLENKLSHESFCKMPLTISSNRLFIDRVRGLKFRFSDTSCIIKYHKLSNRLSYPLYIRIFLFVETTAFKFTGFLSS